MKPKARQYVPPGCPACATDRKGNNYTYVDGVPKRTNEAIVRYLECRFCGNRWRSVEYLNTENVLDGIDKPSPPDSE